MTGAWPGAAVLRDAQQFAAPLALAEAAGFGVVVARAMNPGSFGTNRMRAPTSGLDRTGVALAVLALLAPVLLLPGLAWGAAWPTGRPGIRPGGWPPRA